MNPLDWWGWLFETAQFRSPAGALGLSPGLVWATVSSCLLTWLVCTTIAGLLLWAPTNRSRTRYFRDPATAYAFAAFIAALGGNALVRALMFAWPAYRFQSLTAILAALLAFGVVAVMLPMAMQQQVDAAREERHNFANKVHAEQVAVTTNLLRLEKLQRELLAYVEGLREEQAHPSEECL